MKIVKYRVSVTEIIEGIWPESEYTRLAGEKNEDGTDKHGYLVIEKLRSRTTEVYRLDCYAMPDARKLTRLVTYEPKDIGA